MLHLNHIKKDLIILAVLATLSIITFHGLLSAPGYVLREDYNFPLTLDQANRAISYYSNVWHSQIYGGWFHPFIGSQLSVQLTSYALTLLFGAPLSGKLWLLLIHVSAGASMYYTTSSLIKKKTAGFVSALLYMYNPWILERILSGHLSIILAYSVAPMFFLFLIRCINFQKIKDTIIIGLLLGVILVINPYQIGVLLLLIAFVYYITFCLHILKGRDGARKKLMIRISVSFSILLIIGLTLNSFWIFPYIQFVSTHGEPFSYIPLIEEVEWYSSNANIINVIRMSGYYEGNYERLIQSFSPEFTLLSYMLGFLISIFALLAPLINEKNRTVSISLLILALIGIFMGKGINEPIGNVYSWLYQNLPFFSTFRNPNGFVFLIVFSYPLLISISSEKVSSYSLFIRLRNASSKLGRLVKGRRIRISHIASFSLTLMILTCSMPMLTGDFLGELRPLDVPQELFTVEEILANSPTDDKVLLLNSWPGPSYRFVPPSYRYIQDPFVFFSPKPVVTLDASGPTHEMVRFMLFSLYNNRTEYTGKLLGLLGIRYIVVRTDMIYPNSWSNVTTDILVSEILPYSKGIKLIGKFGDVYLYENEYFSPQIFATNSFAIVAGDRRLLTSLSMIHNFNFSKIPIIFVEQLKNTDVQYLLERSNMLIVQSNKVEDLIFALIQESNIITPSEYLQPSANFSKGWASSVTQYLLDSDGLFEIPTSETIPWIVTKADGATIDLPFFINEDETYEVWIKMYDGPVRFKGSYLPDGQIVVRVDNFYLMEPQRYPTAHLHQNTFGFRWVRFGSIFLKSGEHVLSLMNEVFESGDLSIVSQVAIIPHSSYEDYYEWLVRSLEKGNSDIIYVLEAEDSFNIGNNWEIKDLGSKFSNGLSIATNKENEISETSVETLKSGNYVLAFRLGSEDKSSIEVKIDDYCKMLIVDDLEYYYVGPLQLNNGSHDILIKSINGTTYFDQLVLFTSDELQTLDAYFAIDSDVPIKYERRNPAFYQTEVRIHSDRQILLVLLESYDPLWNLESSVGEYKHIYVNSYANAFLTTGSSDYQSIVIEYEGYLYQKIGTVASVATLFLTLSISIIRWRFKSVK